MLGVRRSTTVTACSELGIAPYIDPHNSDPRFTRSRLRTEVMPLLEEILQGGVAPALARTAGQIRADADVLDASADAARVAATDGDRLDAAALRTLAPAIRRRVLRGWVIDRGATEPTERLIVALDDLVVTPDVRTRVAIGGDYGHRLSVACEGPNLVVRSDPRG